MTGTLFDLSLDPLLKWAGGKRWQIPHVRPLWEQHFSKRLVEPFAGGLAMTLGLRPERALFNDINRHLMNFYDRVALGLQINGQMLNEEAFYYQQRERFNELVRIQQAGTDEAAALFYFLNRTGFNGLCRFNAVGEFNVPFGRYKTIKYTRDFSLHRDALQRWERSCGDFESVPLTAHDFVYADPPYDVPFTDYAQGGFSWQDQVRTAQWLATHRGPVVLVNQATERVDELYRRLGFAISYLDAPRRISCTGDRTPARELLAIRHI